MADSKRKADESPEGADIQRQMRRRNSLPDISDASDLSTQMSELKNPVKFRVKSQAQPLSVSKMIYDTLSTPEFIAAIQ